MRVVQQFHSIEEAQVAKSFLAANDIEAVFVGEESMSAMPHISVGMKSFQLLVQEEDFETASSLFQSLADIPSEEAHPAQSKRTSFLKFIAVGAAVFYLLSFIIQKATS